MLLTGLSGEVHAVDKSLVQMQTTNATVGSSTTVWRKKK
jgi:hypothetical protein